MVMFMSSTLVFSTYFAVASSLLGAAVPGAGLLAGAGLSVVLSGAGLGAAD